MDGKALNVCLHVCVCVRLRGAGKRGGRWLLFIESVLLSYLYHTVLSITQSEYGKSKSCRLAVDARLPRPAGLEDYSGWTGLLSFIDKREVRSMLWGI